MNRDAQTATQQKVMNVVGCSPNFVELIEQTNPFLGILAPLMNGQGDVVAVGEGDESFA